jgi:formylmethanofuran dehydrogenase subunit E-like metal-binding protein
MKPIVPIMFLLLLVATTEFAPPAAAEIEIHKQQSVRYASGGVTPEEIKEMKKLAPRFPVQLYFRAQGSDKPVSGVNVTVRDVQGDTVLQAQSDGPIFFIDVVGGRYTIDAEYDGETLSETKDQTGRRYLQIKYRFNE